MNTKTTLLLLLSIFLFACTTNNTAPQETNTDITNNDDNNKDTENLQDTANEENMKDSLEEKEAINKDSLTNTDSIPLDALSQISCKDNELTFTLSNNKEETWVFGTLPFPAPKNKVTATLTINTYDLQKKHEVYFKTKSFSECVQELEAKDSVTCSVSPIPIVTENSYSKNTISLRTLGVNMVKTFTCDM